MRRKHLAVHAFRRTLFVAGCIVLLCLAACRVVPVVNVESLPYDSHCAAIHIRENCDVLDMEFIPVVEKCFREHGLDARIVSSDWEPTSSDYVATYTVRRHLTVRAPLGYAELSVYKGGVRVAAFQYRVGRVLFMKSDTTEEKITPVINELLKNYPPAPVAES